METISINTYSFNELSKEAQQKAIENLHDINTDHEWYEWVYEDFKTICSILGIEIDNIYFSGFYSQGDGACFEGSYKYNKQAVKKIKEYAPTDTVLHDIAARLTDLQKRNFYQLLAYTKHSGHYYHEYCTDITIERNDYKDISAGVESDMKDTLRSLMKWLYRSLESSYNYLISEEAIKETIIANEYDFYENGKIA